MKTIYKYPIVALDEQHVDMPAGAEILTVQTQNGQPCLWAAVDTDVGIQHTKHIYTFGTGHSLPYFPMRYIGTYQLENGALVFHVFEGG